jgi:ATP-dependent DNA helicase RecQ
MPDSIPVQGTRPRRPVQRTAAPAASRGPAGQAASRKLKRGDSRALEKILRETFGIARLRPGQEEVIASVLAAHDTLAIMPTGAGKSLCYQLPALYLPGTTVVVSPLISLMKDQADKLDEVGVEAAQMNSALSQRDEVAEMKRIKEAKNEVVFATPERLAEPEFIAALQRNRVDLFVVDEAHCISHWGHDFRPAFLEIGKAITALGKPPVLALTATATETVAEDIVHQLGLRDARVINTGVYRPNLHYRVVHVTSREDKLREVFRILRGTDGSGIIYTATVKAAEDVYEELRRAELRVTRYHGQLGARERQRNQDDFMEGRCRIMVATNAFGMGIDKRDIRFIVHYQIPASLEAYYQESGRAGRDRRPAECTLLYDLKDRRVQQFFLIHRYPGEEEIGRVYEGLRSLGAAGRPVKAQELRAVLEGIALAKQQVALKLLSDARLVMQDRGRGYRLAGPADAPHSFAPLAQEYQEKDRHDREKLERMIFYAQTGVCRWQLLLEYFGEQPRGACGACDNCMRPPMPEAPPDALAAGVHTTNARKPPFLEGAAVRVPRYGEGRVVSVADQVTIEFPDRQTRSFLARYVKAC